VAPRYLSIEEVPTIVVMKKRVAVAILFSFSKLVLPLPPGSIAVLKI